MVTFIDDHREEYGVEPICKVLPIAPSTYYAHKAQEADPVAAVRHAAPETAGTAGDRPGEGEQLAAQPAGEAETFPIED